MLLLLSLWGAEGFAQTLDDYLQIAAENNPGVKAAYAEFEAAMQKAPQVSSLPDPELTMSAFGIGPMVQTESGPQMANFSLMQMFPWFGTLGAKEDAAVLMAEAKYQAFNDVRNKLFFKVSEQYFQLYALEKSIRFQEENIKILEDYKELALAEVRSGSGALADVLRTEIRMDDGRTALEILKMQKKPTLVRFNALLNRNENAEVNILEKPEIENFGLKTRQDSLFKNHPRVAQMQKMLAAAEANEKVARKNGLPKLGIGIDYMVIGKGMGMMDSGGDGRDAFMPMVSVSIPIFRKKYKAARKEAEFMQESYSQRIIEVENTLSAEYAETVFTLEKTREMLELYRNQTKNTKRVLDLLLSGYQNATVDFEEVLQTRQALLKYQLNIAQAEADYFTGLSKINYLTTETTNYENQE
ncbi:MAG TPA: TolC family protein [Flavobacteriaceae bacterium]|nr:TolC family protein [Flavobacteriaceae bacterium]